LLIFYYLIDKNIGKKYHPNTVSDVGVKLLTLKEAQDRIKKANNPEFNAKFDDLNLENTQDLELLEQF
jgi:hypothetical protein